MSRSYKHTPYSGLKKDKFFKKYANKKLRHKYMDGELKYNAYKKDLCCYDICDYKEIGTSFNCYYKNKIKNWYRWRQYMGEPFPIKDNVKQEYNKIYRRK